MYDDREKAAFLSRLTAGLVAVCAECSARASVAWVTFAGELELYCGRCAFDLLHRMPSIKAARVVT